MILIGSHAFQFHAGEIGRKPADWDMAGSFDELQQLARALRARSADTRVVPLTGKKTALFSAGEIYDYEIAWPGSPMHEMQLLLETAVNSKVWHRGVVGFVCAMPTLDMLYTLKMSHRYLKNSLHFMKCMRDIHMMRRLGAKIWDDAWMKRREAETYDYGHPKLDVMKGDFFKGDGVRYVYDHDDIHRAVARFNVPAYTMYMRDGAEVQCDKKKFFALDETVRLTGVLEEALVLALERSQIPHGERVSPRRSFEIALEKVCTSITSGWFREYAWENYLRVWALYDDGYVGRFWRAVDEGRVRKLDDMSSLDVV